MSHYHALRALRFALSLLLLMSMSAAWLVGASLQRSAPRLAQLSAQPIEGPSELRAARRLLRRLTLDLWGEPPSLEALQSLERWPSSEQQLDALLSDERASYWLTRFHEDIFWPALEIGDLINPAASLLLPATFYEGPLGGEQLFTLFTGLSRRGGLVPCLDEPAAWDEEGALIMEEQADGTRREGYVWVTPYWSEEPVKVCALESLAEESGPAGVSCESFEGLSSGRCGCGATLERCASIDSALELLSSFRDQVARYAAEHAAEGADYFALLTRAEEPVNGPIAHYYRHLASSAIDPIVLVAPINRAELPSLDFKDRDVWRWTSRAAPVHSGLLTSTPFLLRFQTARARANRVSQALLCEPFIATSGVLPSPEDDCSQEPNLRRRCGCADCHARLEPLSAHWARFSDAGALYLDPERFPSYLASCAACADDGPCPDLCKRFYVSEAPSEAHRDYLGVLKAYEWRGADEIERLEAGPSALIEEAISRGALPRCLTQQLFERLVGRAPHAEERERLRGYAQEFASDASLRALIKRLLNDTSYQVESPALWGAPSTGAQP